MATPVSSMCRVLWYPPETQYRVLRGSHPYALTCWFAELGRDRMPSSMAEAATLEQRFWREAISAGITPLPELRGAILTPALLPYSDIEEAVEPFNSDGTATHWNGPEYPTSPWHLQWLENYGRYGAFLSSTDPHVLRLPAMADGDSFFVRYQLAVPEMTDGDPRPRCGMNLHFASTWSPDITSTYGLNMPVPHPDYPADSVWTAKANSAVLDSRPAPGRLRSEKSLGTLEWEQLEVMSIAGKLVVRTSESEPAWVIGDGVGDYGVPAGAVAIEVYGCRALVQAGRIGYALSATVNGPAIYMPGWSSFPDQADFAGRVGSVGGTCAWTSLPVWKVLDAATRKGRISFGVANQSPLVPGCTTHRSTTPLLVNVQVMAPAIPEATTGTAVDISQHVRAISYTQQASGRGHSARVELDVMPHVSPSASLDVSDLPGMGWVTIELAHQYGGETADGPWHLVFSGFVRNRDTTVAEYEKRLVLDLQDRTLLWEQGRTSAAHMPYVGGMDVPTAVGLCLGYGNTLAYTDVKGPYGPAGSDLVFSSLYSGDVIVPDQTATASAAFAPQWDLVQCLDHICELTGHRWILRSDGKVQVDPIPLVMGVPSFTLLETDGYDVVDLPQAGVTSAWELGDSPNTWYVVGRNSRGATDYYWGRDDATVTDATNPRYLGREVWRTEYDPSNPEPRRTWQLLRQRSRNLAATVQWTMWGRGEDLGLYSKIENQIDRLVLAHGQYLVITGKSGELRLEGNLYRWEETYTAGHTEDGLYGW